MQAPARRILPGPLDRNITKPGNIMKDFEEIENIGIVEFSNETSSNRKKISNSTKTTNCVPPPISITNSIGMEKFVIYEDSSNNVSEEPAKTQNAAKPRKNIKKNTAKSSIPVSKRMTRSNKRT